MPNHDPILTSAQKLNLETAKIHWSELQKFYAQGLILIVDPKLDLVDIAANFVDDDKTKIEALLNDSSVRKAQQDDARLWHENQSTFWAVVTAPWVLVQEIH